MMTTKRVFLAISILWVFSFVGIYAQQTTGTISGTVTDETGGVLPGVSLTARNTGTEATRTVISDDEGRYRLPQLVPGDYELQAELAGFQTAVLQGITLSMAQQAVVSVTLRVGEISEQVVVSAEVSLVETTTANVGALVDNKSISDLPLNGRDFIQLAALQEGIVTPTSARRTVNGDRGVKLSIAGAKPHENAILLDGTDIKNWYGATPGAVTGNLLGVDTVREFRILTSAYSAEYGRFSGGVISAVTKSGTNEIHGTVFEFHRNSALDARNFFDLEPENPLERSDPPAFIRNQFGFTLGGPIVKDRTFIFGSYEGLRERLTTTSISLFPNENTLNGLIPNVSSRGVFTCGPGPEFCQVDIDPAIQPYLDLWPRPNGKIFEDGTGQFIFSNPEPTDQDYFMVKIDHKLSESDNLFVRYTFDDAAFHFLTEAFIYGVDEKSRNQYLTIEEKHIFSPTLLNEVRLAYNRSHGLTNDFENVPIDLSLFFMPGRQAMGLLSCRGCGLSQFGSQGRTPQNHTLNTFQYMDNLVWLRGKHSMKMGVSWSRFQYNLTNSAGLNGNFRYLSIKDLLEASFNEARVIVSDPYRAGMRQNLIGIYFQDDLQLRPNLTVNLGVRYEFITSPTEVAGRLANLQSPFQTEPSIVDSYFENPSLKNFSPRLGFAWDPTGSGKFSVRGGFGLFYEQILQWAYTSAAQRMAPFNIRAQMEESQDEIIFNTALRDLTEDSRAVESPSATILTDPQQPYLMQWNLTLQRQITPSIAATATYAGSRGVHLTRPADVNRPPSTLIDGRYFYDQGGDRANSAFTSITDRRWDGMSYYNALKLGLKKRFTSGFQYQLSYQWQKMMDEGSNVGSSPRSFGTSSWLAENWLDHKIDRGLSAYHTAHVFSSNWVVDLPFGPGRRYGGGLTGLAAKLVEGWQINGIVQLATGSPVNIEGNAVLTCAVCTLLRPNLVPGKSNNPRTGDPNRWFDRDSFEDQDAGTFGTLGRNTGEGPGLATLDLSILKNFSVGETANVQFRAEFFNILNRTNFQGPLRTRVITNTRGQPISNFGQILETVSTSRQIQFALKIVF